MTDHKFHSGGYTVLGFLVDWIWIRSRGICEIVVYNMRFGVLRPGYEMKEGPGYQV